MARIKNKAKEDKEERVSETKTDRMLFWIVVIVSTVLAAAYVSLELSL